MVITSAFLSLAVVAPADAPHQGQPGCTIVRISPDGIRTVTQAADAAEASTGTGRHGARAQARGRSSGSASNSVSVHSSSTGGANRSVASATVRDGTGQRTVTTTHDHNGCTTVIDERAPERNNR